MKNTAAQSLGRLGGSKTSEAKTSAARANGAKGGRPRKDNFAADGKFPRQESNKDIYGNPTGKTSVFDAMIELSVYNMFVIRRGDQLLMDAGVPLAFPDSESAKQIAISGDKFMRWNKVPKFLR